MIKRNTLFGILLISVLLFLTGCQSDIAYTANLFKPTHGNCWPCQLYVMAFNSIGNLLQKALETMAKNCRVIVEYGLMFWLVFKIGPWFWSMQAPNVRKDIKEIAIVFVKTFFVMELLYFPNLIYEYIGGLLLQPIGAMFMNVSEVVLNSPVAIGVDISNYPGTSSATGGSGGGSWWDLLHSFGSLFGSLTGSEKVTAVLDTLDTTLSGMEGFVAPSDPNDMPQAFMEWQQNPDNLNKLEQSYVTGLNDYNKYVASLKDPTGTKSTLVTHVVTNSDRMFGKLPLQIQNIVWQLYEALWSGMGLGLQLLKANSLAGFVSGGILVFAVIAMMIKIPLGFIDAFVRLGITVILLPLFLVAWIFPYFTKGVFQKVMHMLFSAFFDILFNCIYVAFLITLLRVYSKEKLPYVFSSDFQTSEATLRNAGVSMTTGYLLLVVLMLTVLHMSGHVSSISNFFFQGSEPSSLGQLINRAWKLGVSGVKFVFSLDKGKALKEFAEQGQGLVTDAMSETMDAGKSRAAAQAKHKYEYSKGQQE